MFQGCFKDAVNVLIMLPGLPGSFMGLSRVFEGCFKGIPRVFKDIFMGDLRLFKGV